MTCLELFLYWNVRKIQHFDVFEFISGKAYMTMTSVQHLSYLGDHELPRRNYVLLWNANQCNFSSSMIECLLLISYGFS